MDITSASPPSGGACTIPSSVSSGSLVTVNCSGWVDSNLPLTYRFAFSQDIVSTTNEIPLTYSSGTATASVLASVCPLLTAHNLSFPSCSYFFQMAPLLHTRLHLLRTSPIQLELQHDTPPHSQAIRFWSVLRKRRRHTYRTRSAPRWQR